MKKQQQKQTKKYVNIFYCYLFLIGRCYSARVLTLPIHSLVNVFFRGLPNTGNAFSCSSGILKKIVEP